MNNRDFSEKISIIMPAYNEAERISSSIRETATTFNSFASSWELIVIDDGSTDRTFERACQLINVYPAQLIVKKNPYNLGKGRAIKKAFHYVTGEYIVFLDADMDLHPAQIQSLFDIMHLVGADIVIGSKLHPHSKVNYHFQRRLISLVYYLLVRLLFNLPCHDTQTGLKLFKAEVLHKVFPKILVRKFAFDLEVLVNANHLGYKIAEAPIVLSPKRRYGRIGLLAIFTTAWDTLAVFYRMYVLRYHDRIDYYRHKNLAKEFKRMHR